MGDQELTDGDEGLEVINLEFILRLKIKRNDWLLADTCPQAANHCCLFVCLIDSLRPLNNLSVMRDGSSLVEPVLS